MFRRITNVKFICDIMLGGLSKALRKVGIDTISLTAKDNIDHYIQIAQRENRYFLTRGNFYVRVTKLSLNLNIIILLMISFAVLKVPTARTLLQRCE